MTTIKQIAQDPRKALRELEIKLGSDPGDLLKDMEEINWTRAGEKMLAFTAPDTAAWKSGEYRAELWVADKKVQQAQFDITPVEQTEQ